MADLSDACVCCGVYVPEGSMVCPECQKRYSGAGKAGEGQMKEIKPLSRAPTHFFKRIFKKAP